MVEVLSYPLTPILLSLYHVDGLKQAVAKSETFIPILVSQTIGVLSLAGSKRS